MRTIVLFSFSFICTRLFLFSIFIYLLYKFRHIAATWIVSEDAPVVTGGRDGDNLDFNCSIPDNSEETVDVTWYVNEKKVSKIVCSDFEFLNVSVRDF